MSNEQKVHVEFPGRLLFIGFGSIGQGVLPLVLRHIGIAPERITIVTAEDKGNEEAARYGVKAIDRALVSRSLMRRPATSRAGSRKRDPSRLSKAGFSPSMASGRRRSAQAAAKTPRRASSRQLSRPIE